MTSRFLLRAWTVNPVGKGGLWKDYDKRGQLDIGNVRSLGKVVGSLHGLSVYQGDLMRPSVSDGCFALVDEQMNQVALMFTYYETNSKAVIQENVIMVNPSYQGQGLAGMFYEWLLRKYKALKSDTSFSAGAAKMWSRLIQKHSGYVEIRVNHKPVRVDIVGFRELQGVVWPVVLRGGAEVCLGDLVRSAKGKERDALRSFVYVLLR